MVGKLERRSHDPNFRHGPERFRVAVDRGAGLYYHRGNGYYSKYNEKMDGAEFHKRKKVRDVRKMEKDAPHKADYKTRGRGYKTPRLGGGMKGYF